MSRLLHCVLHNKNFDLYIIEQICNKSYKEETSFVNFNLFNELICYRYEPNHNYNKK